MTDSSRIRKTIAASRKVKVWFWDTIREYTGEAVTLTPEDLTALLRMGGSGMSTVIPSKAVMDWIVRHLTGRVVEFRITGQNLEVGLKGTIEEVQKDFENARRLLLVAKLNPTSDHNQLILRRLGQGLTGV